MSNLMNCSHILAIYKACRGIGIYKYKIIYKKLILVYYYIIRRGDKMLKFLYPHEYISSVFEMTADKIKALDIDTVVFDIDNTLVPYWIKVPDERLKAYFSSLNQAGIKTAVLSNSKEERSKVFCASVNMPYIYRAGKPGIKGFKRLMDKIGSEPKRSMIMGDQIFTDVWCGNRAGAYSVLVKQVSPKDELITAPKRPFEKIVIKMYMRYCKKHGGHYE